MWFLPSVIFIFVSWGEKLGDRNMIQALLNTLGKQDLVAEANKMFVMESSKLFHVHYYFFFIAKLALYEVLNLCWRPKLFKFIWVLFLNVRGFFYVFSCCHWLAFNMEVTEEKGLLYMEETVLRIRTLLFYVTVCGIPNSNVALVHFTLADRLSFASKIW